MNAFSKLTPEWILRLGLGLTYAVSAADIIRHPSAWHWVIPFWLKKFIASFVDLNLYLRLQGAIEFVLALIMLAWFINKNFVRYAAFLSALEFASILILAFIPFSQANFLIIFRDIGLLGAALALLKILAQEKQA